MGMLLYFILLTLGTMAGLVTMFGLATRYNLPVSKHLFRPPLDILLTCGVT